VTKHPSAGGLSDLARLLPETRTGLELAIAAFAPNELIDRLAVVTGLIQALAELPEDSPPAMALVPTTVERANAALDAWRTWNGARIRRA
jgi:hypothetical protein